LKYLRESPPIFTTHAKSREHGRAMESDLLNEIRVSYLIL
jgi:hypothetical protein